MTHARRDISFDNDSIVSNTAENNSGKFSDVVLLMPGQADSFIVSSLSQPQHFGLAPSTERSSGMLKQGRPAHCPTISGGEREVDRGFCP